MEGFAPKHTAELDERFEQIVKYDGYVGTWQQAIDECPFLRGFDTTTRDMLLEEGARNFEQLPHDEAVELRGQVHAKLAAAQNETNTHAENKNAHHPAEESFTETKPLETQLKLGDSTPDVESVVNEELVSQIRDSAHGPRQDTRVVSSLDAPDALKLERMMVGDDVELKSAVRFTESPLCAEVPDKKYYPEEAAVWAGVVDDVVRIESTRAVAARETAEAVKVADSFATEEVINKQVEDWGGDDHPEAKIEENDTILREIRQELETTFDLVDQVVTPDLIEEQETVAAEAPSYIEFDAPLDYPLIEYDEEAQDEAVEHIMLLIEQALGESPSEEAQDEPSTPELFYDEPSARREVISIDEPGLVLNNVKHAIMAFETESTSEESEQIDMLYAEMTQITEFLSRLQVEEASEALDVFAQQSKDGADAIEHVPLSAITEEQLIARLEIVCERMLVMLDAPHNKEYIQALIQQLVTLVEDREAWDRSKALTPEELAIMGTREYKLAFRHQQSDDSNPAIGDRFKQIGATALGIFRGTVPNGALALV